MAFTHVVSETVLHDRDLQVEGWVIGEYLRYLGPWTTLGRDPSCVRVWQLSTSIKWGWVKVGFVVSSWLNNLVGIFNVPDGR